MDHNGMEQLTDMGFTRELAAQALAATGGKSTVKATEWILNLRKTDSAQAANVSRQQQVRVDHFFTAGSSKVHEPVPLPDVEAPGTAPTEGPSSLKRTLSSANFRKGKEEVTGTARVGVTITEKALDNAGPEVNVVARAQKQVVLAKPTIQEPPAKKMKPDEQLLQPQQQGQPGQQKSFPFNAQQQKKSSKSMVPLAERMRPTSIEDIIGQEHLLGARGILRSLLENDSLASVILWGPPGTGKTTLARAFAAAVSYRFVALSAVTSGVKEVREVLEEAKKMKKYGQRTLLFLDEVHRFNKAQQDAFLPYVEAGHVVFIGATTENPSFEINAALLSRCKVLTLNKLQPGHLKKLIERATLDKEKGVALSIGLSDITLRVEDDAVNFLAGAADGDARVALNTLEIAVLAASSRIQRGEDPSIGEKTAKREQAEGERMPELGLKEKTIKRESFNVLSVLKENVQHSQQEYTRPFKKFVGGKNVTPPAAEQLPGGASASAAGAQMTEADKEPSPEANKPIIVVTFADVKEALQRSHVFYDKTGEEHYNIISALHKSMRGGDADAAIYWLARMLEGGEGPLYVARRLVRFASEDVGLADPQALPQAVACYQACHFLGMPECNVHLAQCVAYLALAPKSVAVYQAIEAAQRYVSEKAQNEPVPLHLRNAPTKLMKELGYAKGYIYPPSHNGPVEQEYMPPSLRGHKFLRWPPT